MGFVRLATAALLLAAGFTVAVATTRGAAAGGGTPTIAVDTTFNDGNPVQLTFPTPSGATGSGFMFSTAVARQSDGKVVVGGGYQFGSVADFDVARLNADGTLDTSFGTNGYVDVAPVPGVANFIEGIAIQPDGKIVLAGTSNSTEIALVRLTTAGDLDGSFGTGGVKLDGSSDAANGVAIDSSGNILVPTSSGGVNRYTTAGAPDTNFNGTGRSTPVMTQASALAIQPDGKIVVAGSLNMGGLPPPHADVARLNADGTEDTNFGTNGSTDITPGGGNEALNSVTLEGSDILVGGETNQGDGSVLARLTSAGALDTTFGTGGRISETTSGAQVSAVFYSPHPVVVKVLSDSDENQGDMPDDQDSAVCIADWLAGTNLSCVPTGDVETGALQAGAQTVGADGSTVDAAGSTSDGSHVVVTQAKTSDGNEGTFTSTVTNTSETCPGNTHPPPCQYDLAASFTGNPYFTATNSYFTTEHGNLTITNNGPAASPNGQVRVFAFSQGTQPPAGTFQGSVDVGSTTAGCGLGYAASMTCTVPTLDPGDSVDIPFDARVSTAHIQWYGVSVIYESAQVAAPLPSNCNYLEETDCNNNEAEHKSTIPSAAKIAKIEQPLKANDLKAIDGTAKGLGQSARAVTGRTAAVGVRRVQIALLSLEKSKANGKTCEWLASPAAAFDKRKRVKGSCPPVLWLNVQGTSKWTFRFRKPLPPGSYVVYARAIETNGVTDGFFGAAQGNEIAFKLK